MNSEESEAAGSPSLLDSEESKADESSVSSPRQRQAKHTTVESPTSSVFSPIEKRRLHVEDSREDVIAVAERKVCHLEDLLEKNGLKLSVLQGSRLCLRTHI